MNKSPAIGLLERARALAPLIAREADEIERTRRLTQPVTSALIENGLYRTLLPQGLGGEPRRRSMSSCRFRKWWRRPTPPPPGVSDNAASAR